MLERKTSLLERPTGKVSSKKPGLLRQRAYSRARLPLQGALLSPIWSSRATVKKFRGRTATVTWRGADLSRMGIWNPMTTEALELWSKQGYEVNQISSDCLLEEWEDLNYSLRSH